MLEVVPSDYNVGLIITNDTVPGQHNLDADRTTLRLKYYVILTSKKDLFPKHFLEKKLGVTISAIARYSASMYSFNFIVSLCKTKPHVTGCCLLLYACSHL